MFYSEINVSTASGMHKIFMQPGFFPRVIGVAKTHKHSYTEVHVVQSGAVTYLVDNKRFVLRVGEGLAIPEKLYHRCLERTEDACSSSFLIDRATNIPQRFSIHEDLTKAYFEELSFCEKTEDFSRMVSYISLLLAEVFPEKLSAKAIEDYNFLIHDYLTTHSAEDISVSDLADALHLSPRQTERLIKEYTGNTFRKELTEVRLLAAKYLLESTDMSAEEIATQVGYRSYTGFWRAMKEHGYNLALPSKDE